MSIAVYRNSIYIYCNEFCPFGRRPIDLSSEIMTDDHKRWFAQHLCAASLRSIFAQQIPSPRLLKNTSRSHTHFKKLEKEFLSLSGGVGHPDETVKPWILCLNMSAVKYTK